MPNTIVEDLFFLTLQRGPHKVTVSLTQDPWEMDADNLRIFVLADLSDRLAELERLTRG